MQQKLVTVERLKAVIRAYDIRGLVPESLSEEEAYLLGVILTTSFKNQNSKLVVVIGMDNRKSSEFLKKALIEGLISVGAEILDLGLIPTPLLYHAVLTNATNSLGIMITASHNPENYNGFKIVWQNLILDGEALITLLNNYCQKFITTKKSKAKTAHLNYLDWILEKSGLLNLQEKVAGKILWDCNFGATQGIIKALQTRISFLESEIINMNDFIIGDPDPGKKERIIEIKAELINKQYDLAFCFDGDGDRLLVVTKEGKILRGDKLLLLYAKYFQVDWLQSKIIVDIKTSPVIVRELIKLGYEVFIERTGHSFIKKAMKEKNAIIGGEISGHLFFNCNNYPYDDAILAALFLLKIYITNKEIFYSLLQSLPIFPAIYDVKLPYFKPLQVDLITKLVAQKENTILLTIDGVKFIDEQGSWLIRKSNTEETIILCIEGYSEQYFLQKVNQVKKILLGLGLDKELLNLIDNEIAFDKSCY
jgi:phosphomannomutase